MSLFRIMILQNFTPFVISTTSQFSIFEISTQRNYPFGFSTHSVFWPFRDFDFTQIILFSGFWLFGLLLIQDFNPSKILTYLGFRFFRDFGHLGTSSFPDFGFSDFSFLRISTNSKFWPIRNFDSSGIFTFLRLCHFRIWVFRVFSSSSFRTLCTFSLSKFCAFGTLTNSWF